MRVRILDSDGLEESKCSAKRVSRLVVIHLDFKEINVNRERAVVCSEVLIE